MPVVPVDLTDVLGMILPFLLVMIPVTGITARFALKPIVEAIARLRESGQSGEALRMIERRMDLLEQEMQSIHLLREDVSRLVEAQEFQLRLAAPRDPVTTRDA